MLAEGETLNADFLASLCAPERRARDVMTAAVAAVGRKPNFGRSRGCSRLTAYSSHQAAPREKPARKSVVTKTAPLPHMPGAKSV